MMIEKDSVHFLAIIGRGGGHLRTYPNFRKKKLFEAKTLLKVTEVIYQARTAKHWVVRTSKFEAGFQNAQRRGLDPEQRLLLMSAIVSAIAHRLV
jgi:hypothetical protein